MAYMHALAWDAAAILSERWSTAVETPRELVGTMVTVPLPPYSLGPHFTANVMSKLPVFCERSRKSARVRVTL